jgi:iron complex transport system substrate-binding protein
MPHDIEWLAKTAIDCGFQVHDDIGPGLLETAYEAFLAAHLAERGLRIEVQKPVPVKYRGVLIRDAFRADLLLEGMLVIESSRWSGCRPSIQSNCSPTSG